MRKCLKCGEGFPKKLEVDGKIRNLQNRKFCLTCSPFGNHNTRDISEGNDEHIYHSECKECGKPFNTPIKKRAQCFSCYFNRRQKIAKEKAQVIVGTKCWFCGYDKTWRALDFHHINPEEKKFGLSTREMVGNKYSEVLNEMKKCVLCCKNCHAEIHEGIILEKEVKNKHKGFWL